MRLGGHRPGTITSFVDGASGDVLLQVASAANGEPRIAFRMFDGHGNLVSDSDGFQSYPGGLLVRDAMGELLLLLPAEPEGNIQYRLYSSSGRLLAASDGARTQIFGGLRLDGSKPAPGVTPMA